MSVNKLEIKLEGFRKRREAFLAALWFSVPMQIRAMTKGKLKKDGYVSGDADLEEIVLCKNQGELAKKINVSQKQISEWKDDEAFQALVAELSKVNNVHRYKHDIDLSFTRKTLKTADAQRVKLWYQIFENWKEGIDLSGKFLPFQINITRLADVPESKDRKK